MEWSIYNYMFFSKKANGYLLYSSLSNMLVKINDNEGYNQIMEIVKNPNIIDKNDDSFNFLFEGRFIVESNEKEKNEITLASLANRFKTNYLGLTIAPTRACNFNCHYCYEKDRANIVMSDEV